MNSGPYIYRKPDEGEVLEHPFRVPEWGGYVVEMWSIRREVWALVGHLNDYEIWRLQQNDAPPPELLELAERVRKESNE